jgi:hypothetical protein
MCRERGRSVACDPDATVVDVISTTTCAAFEIPISLITQGLGLGTSQMIRLIMAQTTDQHGLRDKGHTNLLRSLKTLILGTCIRHPSTASDQSLSGAACTAVVQQRSKCSMPLSRAFDPLSLLCASRGEGCGSG